MAEEVLVCPFCGAPHRESIPVGVVQVKCHYCGAGIIVPPRLGGIVQRCPNHPETLAVGLCNDCGNSFCDRCLYIWQIKHGRLNICSSCFDSRNSMKSVGAILGIVMSVIFFLFFLFAVSRPSASSGSSLAVVLFSAIFSLVFSVAMFVQKTVRTSVHDFIGKTGRAPGAFLKKCVDCGKEIPLASEQCQYCDSEQPEYTG